MSEPIKPGDLVVQVRACCYAEVWRATEHAMCFGRPFIVTRLSYQERGCPACGFKGRLQIAYGRIWGVYVGWLKRIDQPESERTPTEEEITA